MWKWLLLVLGLFGLGMMPRYCAAMTATDAATLHGAQRAFTACKNQQGVHVLSAGHVVCLRGKIDPAMFINLVQARDAIASHPFVVVSGIGGYENSSFGIVRLLDRYDPTPVVGDMCASACAQFLFLMGRQRVALHCADIAIHGGPGSVASILAMKSSDETKQAWIIARWHFIKFYADRGISLDLVNDPPADVRKKLAAGQIVFWPWSIDQLRAFGVKGIISANDPSAVVPKDYAKVCIKPLPRAAGGKHA